MSASSSQSTPLGPTPFSTSTDFLNQGSPPPPTTDFLLQFSPSPHSIPHSPQSSRFIPSEILQTGSYLPVVAPTPLASYSVKIEPMSAVAIFALLCFFPKGSLIGIDTKGTLEIQRCDTYYEYLMTTITRMALAQNGDQLASLIQPITTACSIYEHTNEDVGFIFLYAFLGAEQLKERYISKERSLAVVTIQKISMLFFEQVKKCHAARPLPFHLAQNIGLTTPTYSYGQAQIPESSAPHSPPLKPTPVAPPTILERPIWKYDDLQSFSKALTDVCTAITLKQPIDTKLTDLMRRIELAGLNYRNYFPIGRHW